MQNKAEALKAGPRSGRVLQGGGGGGVPDRIDGSNRSPIEQGRSGGHGGIQAVKADGGNPKPCE